MDEEDIGPFGQDFDAYLEERGALDEVRDYAVKAVFAFEVEAARKELGLSKKQLAEKLGTSRSQLDRMLDPHNASTTLASLEELAVALGRSVHITLADGRGEKADPGLGQWSRTFSRKILRRLGLNEVGKSADALGAELLAFFGVRSVAEYEARWSAHQVAYRHSKSQASSTEALRTWLRLGQIEADRVSAPAFDRGSALGIIPDLRRLTLVEPSKFLAELPVLCREAGVAVAVVPGIEGARLSGAAYRAATGSGVVQLSFRHKTNDHFWFTFFHELGHLVLHGEECVFADDEKASAEDGIEREADGFAEEHLVGSARFEEFCRTRPRSGKAIVAFAEDIGVQPGIVVGMLQHRNCLPWTNLNGLKQKFEFEEVI
jgi:transcriptional regulator with XRE-family HTH domain